jgi:hypothetical protein
VFEEVVLSRHMKKAERLRRRVAPIPASQLEVVEGNHKLRKDAAKKCRALLSRARADLAKEKTDFLKKSESERQKEEKQAKANGKVSVTSVKTIGITLECAPQTGEFLSQV